MAEQINDRTDEEQMIEENTNIRSYLTFIANGLTYGVDTMHVVEIITDYSIRPVPLVPEYIKGIINLRGRSFLSLISVCALAVWKTWNPTAPSSFRLNPTP